MHAWPIDKIKKGNQRDRAQSLKDIVEYLREEEEKKIYGKIQRFFEISQAKDEPRIGLKNAASLQNMMIKMASFDETQKRLIFSDIACLCSSCNVGKFDSCAKYTHRIVTAQISSTKSKSIKKLVQDEFQDQEEELRHYYAHWDKQMIENHDSEIYSDECQSSSDAASFETCSVTQSIKSSSDNSVICESPDEKCPMKNDSCSDKFVIMESDDEESAIATKTTGFETVLNAEEPENLPRTCQNQQVENPMQDKKGIRKKTNLGNDKIKKIRKELEKNAATFEVQMIPRNSETRNLTLHFSRSEVKLANQEQRHWETRNDCLSPFGRSRQYEIGDIDFIINRWRGSNIQGAKTMAKPFNNGYDCVSPSTINDLIKMIINQPSATAEELMEIALRPDKLERALPSKNNLRILAIGLYGSTGLRRKIKAGKFGFGGADDSGHYICCKLDIESANVTFFDSLNHNIQSSSYFDWPILIRLMQILCDYYRIKQNLNTCELAVNQPFIQFQRGQNCGCHCLMNLELILFGGDPAETSFKDDIIKDIRRYQFLLRHTGFSEYRLNFD